MLKVRRQETKAWKLLGTQSHKNHIADAAQLKFIGIAVVELLNNSRQRQPHQQCLVLECDDQRGNSVHLAGHAGSQATCLRIDLAPKPLELQQESSGLLYHWPGFKQYFGADLSRAGLIAHQHLVGEIWATRQMLMKEHCKPLKQVYTLNWFRSSELR